MVLNYQDHVGYNASAAAMVIPNFVINWEGWNTTHRNIYTSYGKGFALNNALQMAKQLTSLCTDWIRGLDMHLIVIFKNLPFNFESTCRISGVCGFWLWLTWHSSSSAAPASTLPAMDASNSTRSSCQAEPGGRASWTHRPRFRVPFVPESISWAAQLAMHA